MIKVMHLITDLWTGGTEMMLYKLLSRIDQKKYSSFVVSMTDGGQLVDQCEALSVPVITLGMQRGMPNPVGMWRLGCVLRKERPVILQTWLYHADLLGLVVGRLVGVPAIAWNIRCSEMDFGRYRKLTSLVVTILTRLSRGPSVVITNSQAGRRAHETIGYRPRKWMMIPNGFDLDRFCPDPRARIKLRHDLNLPEHALLIGLIARFDPMKDHRSFFEAAHLFLRSYPKAHFVLAGFGIDYENADLVHLVTECSLNSHIHLLGERNDIPTVIAGLDVASSSSSYGEGSPNVIGEAMACGVPCVVTNVGDSAWIVGETGRVVPARNPQALANAWAELVELGPEARIQLGLSARQRVREHFDLAAIVKQYEHCYEELAAGGSCTSPV